MTAPRILISNDDGIFAEGLRVLAGALEALGEVWVVAPDRERSGSGHSLTLHNPLRVEEVQKRWYAVDGT
ncbi:MAG: 5'/3'-nucleotidase SurE, partial [Candidatus Tectimicrobiota bacterium]